MPYTTADAVMGIIEVDDGIDLTPFIEAADALVVEVCSAYYDNTRLELIERWLAAHFFAINTPRTQSDQVDVLNESNEPLRVGLGLQLTKYGQQALRMDTGGYLAAMDNALNDVKKPLPGSGRKFTVTYLGQDCD